MSLAGVSWVIPFAFFGANSCCVSISIQGSILGLRGFGWRRGLGIGRLLGCWFSCSAARTLDLNVSDLYRVCWTVGGSSRHACDLLHQFHGAFVALTKDDVACALGSSELRAPAFIQTRVQGRKVFFRDEELLAAA